ncbi:MAG: diguanylate cyclase [Gemmatimonadota bacterium]
MAPRKAWNKKTTLVALRVCATVVTGVLLGLYPPAGGVGLWLLAPWGLYLATTIGYILLPSHWFGNRRFDFIFVGIELMLLGTLFAVYFGTESWLFYSLFLLTVLLAGLARRILWSLALGGTAAVIHVVVNQQHGQSDLGVLILQVLILLMTAGAIGYLTEELDSEEATTALLDNALEITTLIAGALEAEIVYQKLTEVLARLFRAGRVAVILTRPGSDAAQVVAAVERGEAVQDLTIELERYPEIQTALERRAPVFISRADSHPRLAGVRGSLPRRARGAAILVTPILQEEEPRGVVLVRLEQNRREFSDHEIKFCRLMADVAGQALQRAEHFAEVTEAARRDSLTGLFNVRLFHRRLAEEIDRSERTGSRFSLIMIDVDYLKQVNDTYGHLAGDQVLRRFARILTEEVRNIDTVARYGGEEFAMLLPETGAERAFVVAERLRARLAAAEHEGLRSPVTASLGVATCPDDAMTPSDVLHKADLALYASKARGRNRTTRYDAEIKSTSATVRMRSPETAATEEDTTEQDPTMVQTIREALGGLEPNREVRRHLDVIASLATVMRAKDPDALDHLRDVSTLADMFITHLPITERQRWMIHVACLLRDIGKLAIGEDVLQKKDFLTREEYEVVRQHPLTGAQIIEPLIGLEGVIPLIRHHHERWDGKGYPDGVRGEEIPYGARVVGLVDAFYAMVRRRPYASRARGLRYATEEIRRNAGTQFDPELAARFLFIIEANRDIVSTLVIENDEPGANDAPDAQTDGQGVSPGAASVGEPAGAAAAFAAGGGTPTP